MSASARLSKLKNSPIIRDIEPQMNQRVMPNRMQQQQMQQQQMNNQSNTSSQPRNMVQPMTVLTWHEQRLNKMDETLKTLKNGDNQQAIISLIDTIEALEKKINVLSQGYNNLLKTVNGKKKGKPSVSLKDEVAQELNKVKLTVSDK